MSGVCSVCTPTPAVAHLTLTSNDAGVADMRELDLCGEHFVQMAVAMQVIYGHPLDYGRLLDGVVMTFAEWDTLVEQLHRGAFTPSDQRAEPS